MKVFDLKAGEAVTINSSIIVHSTKSTTLKILGPIDLHCFHERDKKRCQQKQNCEKSRESK